MFPLSILLLLSGIAPADSGYLTVKSNSVGIAVYLDGDFLGRTPVEMHQLKPGTYSVSINAANFDKWSATGVVLTVRQSLRLDAELNIGTVQQEVQVTGESISAIARDLNLSRNTVKKYLNTEADPAYQRGSQPAPKLGAFQSTLDSWLTQRA